MRILIGNVGPAYDNGVLDDLHRMVNVLIAYSSVPEDEFWGILNDRELSAEERAKKLLN